MKNVIFFNTYHIGDIFWPLSFIKNIVENNPEYNFFYWIPQGHAFYNNLKINFANNINLQKLASVNLRVVTHFEDVTVINTWVRSFWEDPEYSDIPVGECNMYDKYYIFKRICEKLNFKFTLNVKDIIYSLPEVEINSFLEWNNNLKDRKKIFYFNYLGMSGQPTSIGNPHEHELVINTLSDKYPDRIIIVPDGTNVEKSNVINCQQAFNINRDVTCENVIKMHLISNYCDYVVYSATGACFVALNKQCLETQNKKIYLYAGDSRKFGDAMNSVTTKLLGRSFLQTIDCQGANGVLENLYNVIAD
jgi:hypothetical protein